MNYKYPTPPEHFMEDNKPISINLLKKANYFYSFGLNENFIQEEVLNPNYLKDIQQPLDINFTKNIKTDLNNLLYHLKDYTKEYLHSLINDSNNIKDNRTKIIVLIKYFFYYIKELKWKLQTKADLIKLYKNENFQIQNYMENVNNIINNSKNELKDLLNN